VVVRRPLVHLHPVQNVTCFLISLCIVQLNDPFVDPHFVFNITSWRHVR
jgi:hypothetical protein